jgi:hypothetical protein
LLPQGERQKEGRNKREISAVSKQKNWRKNEAKKEENKAAEL